MASALCLTACGGDTEEPPDAFSCAFETRADDYVAGLEKTGAAGARVVLVESRPGPPVRGDNSFTLEVFDLGDIALVGAAVEVDAFMPDQRVGTPVEAQVSDGLNGAYEAAPITLWRNGLWEVTVAIDDGVALSDEVVFRFCVDR